MRIEAHARCEDELYDVLSGVCTAFDTVEARRQVDHRCIKHKKPLLDSGFRGSMAHMEIVIPYMTESHGSRNDRCERVYPICGTFPWCIAQTCQWAGYELDQLFHPESRAVSTFLPRQDRMDGEDWVRIRVPNAALWTKSGIAWEFGPSPTQWDGPDRQ